MDPIQIFLLKKKNQVYYPSLKSYHLFMQRKCNIRTHLRHEVEIRPSVCEQRALDTDWHGATGIHTQPPSGQRRSVSTLEPIPTWERLSAGKPWQLFTLVFRSSTHATSIFGNFSNTVIILSLDWRGSYLSWRSSRGPPYSYVLTANKPSKRE